MIPGIRLVFVSCCLVWAIAVCCFEFVIIQIHTYWTKHQSYTCTVRCISFYVSFEHHILSQNYYFISTIESIYFACQYSAAILVLVQMIRKCVRVCFRTKHSIRQGNIYKQNLHSDTRRKILNQSTLYQINCDYVFIECCCFACSWIWFSGLRIHFNLLNRSSRRRRSQFLCRCQCRRHRCYIFHIDEVRLFQNLLWWWLLLLFLFG